jgi:restriction system protein
MRQPDIDPSHTPRTLLPWWLCYVLAGVAYLLLVYLIPALTVPGVVSKPAARLARDAGLPVTIAFLVVAPVLFVKQRRRRQQSERPSALSAIRALSDRQFEQLLAAAFQQQGYSVDTRVSTAADGIDLVLRQDGSVTLVQCGYWRGQRVDAEPVRALYKVMTAEQATGALIVTTGRFTAEAMALAQSKPIGLIEGPALLELLQSAETASPEPPPAPSDRAPTCHICSRPMVRRIARKGFGKSEAYWECSGSPYCKGTRLERAA